MRDGFWGFDPLSRASLPFTKPQQPSAFRSMSSNNQADLRLVNLVSRGVPMAEAKKRLGFKDDKPEPVSKTASSKPEQPAKPTTDDALL